MTRLDTMFSRLLEVYTGYLFSEHDQHRSFERAGHTKELKVVQGALYVTSTRLRQLKAWACCEKLFRRVRTEVGWRPRHQGVKMERKDWRRSTSAPARRKKGQRRRKKGRKRRTKVVERKKEGEGMEGFY